MKLCVSACRACSRNLVSPHEHRKHFFQVLRLSAYRDDWGVPHVYSDREEDGFYGLGYAQAEDRLEGILRRYLSVRGESASVFGPEAVQGDLRSLQWMHLEEARSGFRRLEPQLQKDYRYFTAGVERYMREHPREVPGGLLRSTQHFRWLSSMPCSGE